MSDTKRMLQKLAVVKQKDPQNKKYDYELHLPQLKSLFWPKQHLKLKN